MNRSFALLLGLAIVAGHAAETACPFNEAAMSFQGTPLEQTRCLLRPVSRYGRLEAPLSRLPSPLDELIGKPVAVTAKMLSNYLRSHNIADSDVGGPFTNHLDAKYFVIHDTSTPNYQDQPFPTNINTGAWPQNSLERWRKSPVAHLFVNRLGESLTAHPWTTPWRATKLEVRVLGEKSRGLFVHTELIQPRHRDPEGGPKNDAIAPDPGFTKAQLQRLALLYVTASAQHGAWMVPAYHAAVDAGIPDGHDDPQNFDLQQWAECLGGLLHDLKNTSP